MWLCIAIHGFSPLPTQVYIYGLVSTRTTIFRVQTVSLLSHQIVSIGHRPESSPTTNPRGPECPYDTALPPRSGLSDVDNHATSALRRLPTLFRYTCRAVLAISRLPIFAIALCSCVFHSAQRYDLLFLSVYAFNLSSATVNIIKSATTGILTAGSPCRSSPLYPSRYYPLRRRRHHHHHHLPSSSLS